MQDCHRRNQNLSIAWIHVKEAFDSIDHGWINEMTAVHRFPKLPTIAVCCLSDQNRKYLNGEGCKHFC